MTAIRYLTASLLLCASMSAHAWSEADTKRETTYLILHAIDWVQTLDISGQCPDRFVETNPILGECPSRGEVNRYFLLTGIAHYGVARLLPPKQRRWFQYITIGIEAGVVAHNLNIGLHVRF